MQQPALHKLSSEVKSEADRFFPWLRPLAAPLRKERCSGLVRLTSYSCGELQLRIQHNIASLRRRDVKRNAAGRWSRSGETLVFRRKSQSGISSYPYCDVFRKRTFTSKARHLLREAGAVLEAKYQKDILFITLTLPGSSLEAINAFASVDKEIRNAFLQNVRYVFNKRKSNIEDQLDYCGVSELQKRGAIHFHFAIGAHNKRFSRLIKRLCRRWWHKLLLHYSRKLGVDLAMRETGESWLYSPRVWRVQAAFVYKSVQNYLAKYLSKCDSKGVNEHFSSPSRFWCMSEQLRKQALAARNSTTYELFSWEDAATAVRTVTSVLASYGRTGKLMRHPITGEPLGVVWFGDSNTIAYLRTWLSELIKRVDTISAVEEHCLFLPPKEDRKFCYLK